LISGVPEGEVLVEVTVVQLLLVDVAEDDLLVEVVLVELDVVCDEVSVEYEVEV